MAAPVTHEHVNAADDRAAWLAARRKGLGGSDIAAILGMNPWKTPLGVYLDKTGEMPDEPQSHRAEWGLRLERVILDGAVDALNADREEPLELATVDEILAHPDHGWMLASLDGCLDGDPQGPGVAEAKSTSYWARQQWEDGDTLPDAWHCQVQWYLAVTGWQWGVIAVLWDTANLHLEHVEADREFQSALVEVGERFWRDHVLAGNPPAAGAGDDELTKRLHPEPEPGSSVLLPDEAREVIAERNAARAAEKHAAERRKAAEARIRQLLGDAEEGWFPGDPRPAVRFPVVETQRLDGKALREAHPDIAAEFTTPSTYRRLSVAEGE